jgi:hypothetical protein
MAHTIFRWLRRHLGIDRRWAVRYAKGAYERTGFYSQGEAEAWLRDHDLVGITMFYDPAVDMRILDDHKVVGDHRPIYMGGPRIWP